MRDQQDGALVGGKPSLKPEHGIEVEVVGRFVEQQELGGRHEGARQCQPHAPAAGKAVDGLNPLPGREAQPGQKLFCARGGAPGACLDQFSLEFGNLGTVVIGWIHRACRKVLPEGRALCLQASQVHVAIDDEFARGGVGRGNFLLHAGRPPTGGNVERAGICIDLVLQQGKQCGFACPVLADEADPLAGMHDKVGLVQQHLGAAAQGEPACPYHDSSCSRVRSRIWSWAVAVSSHTGSRCANAASKWCRS